MIRSRFGKDRGPGRSRGIDRLGELDGFGANPGALRARTYLPAELAPGAPLVVVLHGCTQTAAAYDLGSGWSSLADQYGFALLYPEQQRANNGNLCFNWFEPGDIKRGGGEAASIAQMIAAMIGEHDIDPARVFVTGLSAGGAMTSVMLATYPELFAGGAIIAGLPYGTTGSVQEALGAMQGQGRASEAELAALVRGASPHQGPWPTLSIWHGSADHTVSPANAGAILAQWRGVMGLPAAPTRSETIDGQRRRLWCDGEGRALIEDFTVAGMGHGTPLATSGADACGARGAHMLEAGISSTRHIARFWGILAAGAAPAAERVAEVAGPGVPALRVLKAERIGDAPRAQPAASGVGKVIEDALRAAGLMR